MNAQGFVTEWNPAAERLFGYSREEARGRELSGLIVPELFQEAHRKGMACYLESGENTMVGRTIEMTARRADGSEFPAEFCIAEAGESETRVFAGYIRDISDRDEVREALFHTDARHTALLNAAMDAIVSLDYNGVVMGLLKNLWVKNGNNEFHSPKLQASTISA